MVRHHTDLLSSLRLTLVDVASHADGRTPLHNAAYVDTGHIQICKILESSGADVNAKDNRECLQFCLSLVLFGCKIKNRKTQKMCLQSGILHFISRV